MLYITCSGKKDDGGARLLALLSVYVFYLEYKTKLNLTYLHTPFHYSKFNINFKKKKSYKNKIKKWDDFIKLEVNELLIDNYLDNKEYIRDCQFKLIQLIKNINNRSKKQIKILNEIDNKILVISSLQYFFDKGDHNNLYNKWKNHLHDKFKISSSIIYSPQFKSYFNNNYKNIVIHIRRGDIKKDSGSKYISDEYYLKVIDKFHEILKFIKYKIYIFTQEKNFNKDLYINKNCIIRTDSDDNQFTAFNHMILADILVIPKSAFSYTAALLNINGIVFYKKLFHKPLNNWLLCNDLVDGKFSYNINNNVFDHLK